MEMKKILNCLPSSRGGGGPFDPTWRIHVGHPQTSTADLAPCILQGRRRVRCRRVRGLPAAQSWAVRAPGFARLLESERAVPAQNCNGFFQVQFGEPEYRLVFILLPWLLRIFLMSWSSGTIPALCVVVKKIAAVCQILPSPGSAGS